MRKIISIVILLSLVVLNLSCIKNQKQNSSEVFFNENNNEEAISNNYSFNEANKLLMTNALGHKYHWYQNADNSEGGLLVIDKKADTEWIKQNLLPTFKFIQSIEIKNNDLSIIPLLKNCTIGKIYNEYPETQIDLLTFPKSYKHLTFYDYKVKNLSCLKEFNNLTMLNIDISMEELMNTSSTSITKLIIRNNDIFDFSILKNFPNLSILNIEKSIGLSNIEIIANSKLKVLSISNEEIYLKHKEEFEILKLRNSELSIWYGKE